MCTYGKLISNSVSKYLFEEYFLCLSIFIKIIYVISKDIRFFLETDEMYDRITNIRRIATLSISDLQPFIINQMRETW